MTLIDEVYFNENSIVKFYEGVDFDVLIDHPKDGRSGFIFCFIENWKKEVKSFNRQNKINSLVENKQFTKFSWESINNNFISIYQTEGIGFEVVYETIRKKVLKNQLPDQPWIPINGISTGAWKIK